MTYDELVVALSDYLENAINTVDLNTCIVQAEVRIYNAVQLAAASKTTTLTIPVNTQYLDCPADFISPLSFAVVDGTTGAYSFMLNKDVSFMREAYPMPTTQGTPKFYAIYGPQDATAHELKFIFAPTADLAYTAELQYFFYPESITTVAGGHTWLGDHYSPALLYGALVEAYTFMKGETDMMALYDTKFKEALGQLKMLGDGLQQQDTYRNGQTRVAVR